MTRVRKCNSAKKRPAASNKSEAGDLQLSKKQTQTLQDLIASIAKKWQGTTRVSQKVMHSRCWHPIRTLCVKSDIPSKAISIWTEKGFELLRE